MVRQQGLQPRKTTQRALAPRSPFAAPLPAPKQTRNQPPRRHLHSPHTHHYTSRLTEKLPFSGRTAPYDVLHHSDDDPDWDEETTLIALLDDHDHPGHDDKTTLVDRLGPAFAAHPQVRSGRIKQTYVPVIRRTKQVHDAIDQDIFVRRSQGFSVFDENSRHFEDTARREYDAVHITYTDTKKSLEALFVDLENLIRGSDVLFQDFKAMMDKYVHHLRECADQAPGDVERLISKLDKKAKQLGAEDHAKAKERFLRGILEKY
ncbi:hypothetical protein PAXRUDRAFT_357778 [Paxillus rubicundulus Ve08.2h10]|uniref:Uncharacterized protein n=1 Tax=Paxillus rubicundulus Ve08.2h10 TaxID=930991 RepID=A0A0D0EDD4_9AGAM|nr:hypothetical protein PAXRUDRAFT_357778 [Paxillus rubicundulus Ve08.2h10]